MLYVSSIALYWDFESGPINPEEGVAPDDGIDEVFFFSSVYFGLSYGTSAELCRSNTRL